MICPVCKESHANVILECHHGLCYACRLRMQKVRCNSCPVCRSYIRDRVTENYNGFTTVKLRSRKSVRHE